MKYLAECLRWKLLPCVNNLQYAMHGVKVKVHAVLLLCHSQSHYALMPDKKLDRDFLSLHVH